MTRITTTIECCPSGYSAPNPNCEMTQADGTKCEHGFGKTVDCPVRRFVPKRGNCFDPNVSTAPGRHSTPGTRVSSVSNSHI